ncbi:hypothetical protein ACIQU6_30555 [Streptomyces sp. NPDC090442]|uniref:hypothetical protein n=1 Tax=Streptomyces sp. NPDC090442 TaxID=3365962 RepID=UPI0038282682
MRIQHDPAYSPHAIAHRLQWSQRQADVMRWAEDGELHYDGERYRHRLPGTTTRGRIVAHARVRALSDAGFLVDIDETGRVQLTDDGRAARAAWRSVLPEPVEAAYEMTPRPLLGGQTERRQDEHRAAARAAREAEAARIRALQPAPEPEPADVDPADCTHAVHAWIYVTADPITRQLGYHLACACGQERDAYPGRTTAMSIGTPTRPLGIRESDPAVAVHHADTRGYSVTGWWTVVDEHTKRARVEDHTAEPSWPVVDDPNRRPAPAPAAEHDDDTDTLVIAAVDDPARRPAAAPTPAEETRQPAATQDAPEHRRIAGHVPQVARRRHGRPRLNPWVARVDSYLSSAHLATVLQVDAHGTATGDVELSDEGRRGPERRELAARLAARYGVRVHTVQHWSQPTLDGAQATDARGHLRPRQVEEPPQYGHGRTDLMVSGPVEAVARYIAMVPAALDAIDKLSSEWVRPYRQRLTADQAPGRTAAVRRWRHRFAAAVITALSTSRSPSNRDYDPTREPNAPEAAAGAALRNVEWYRWLDALETPAQRTTAATYEGSARHDVEPATRAADAPSTGARRQEMTATTPLVHGIGDREAHPAPHRDAYAPAA